jgi:hypothetical protein
MFTTSGCRVYYQSHACLRLQTEEYAIKLVHVSGCLFHRQILIKFIASCQILSFHGGDYEDCLLLGYKTLVRTSQEKPYLSVTETSRLMLSKIWGFHGIYYEEFRLLGSYAVWILLEPRFRERIASIVRVTWIGGLGTTLAVTSNRSTLWRNSSPILVILMVEAIHSSETSALTRTTRPNIPEGDFLHSHLRESLRNCLVFFRMHPQCSKQFIPFSRPASISYPQCSKQFIPFSRPASISSHFPEFRYDTKCYLCP